MLFAGDEDEEEDDEDELGGGTKRGADEDDEDDEVRTCSRASVRSFSSLLCALFSLSNAWLLFRLGGGRPEETEDGRR